MKFIKIKKILQPGEAGTKRLLEIYEDKLVCVRYKYDYKRNLRYKTIELIVDEKTWKPDKSDSFLKKIVNIRIDYRESELRKKVKKVGGVWNRSKKLWEVPIKGILKYNLEGRVVE